MNLEYIILTLSYFGIFILMTSNGIISFPSSQLIYIIAGYFAFKGDLNFTYILVIGAFAQSLGNYILYEISRQKGLKYSLKFIKFLFQLSDPEKEIKKFQVVFNKRQKFWLFLGKLINPIKIFISIPAGIIKMNRIIFITIVYISSLIWALIFTSIGFFFGKSYTNFGYIGAVILVIAVIILSYFYKQMNKKEVLDEINKKN